MSAPGDQCTGLTWTYDAWGNRTDQTAAGGTCDTFQQTIDADNHLPGPTFQYDAAGNLTYDGSHSYTYDAESRITKVDGSAGYCYAGSGTAATACYVYDANGNRVEKRVGSTVSDYYRDVSGHVTAEWHSGSDYKGWAYYWAYLGNQMIAEYGSNTTFFPITDQLGSTRLLTAYPTPTVAECDDYYPFGELISCGGTSTTPFKFTGYERDTETNLDDANARYFASSLARFMSPDPSGLSLQNPADPQTLNLYSYVRNNPLTNTDPTGLDFCEGVGPPCEGLNLDFSGAGFADGASNFTVGADINPPSAGGGNMLSGNNEFDALNASAAGSAPEGVYQPQGDFSVSATGWSWSPDSFTGFQYTDAMGVKAPVIFNSWADYADWSTGIASATSALNDVYHQYDRLVGNLATLGYRNPKIDPNDYFMKGGHANFLCTSGCPGIGRYDYGVHSPEMGYFHDDTVSPWTGPFQPSAMLTANFWEHGLVDLIGGQFVDFPQ